MSASDHTRAVGSMSDVAAKESGVAPPGSPIVDVGIPTLGLSPYLVEAVESVFAQTFPSWRLVISENGPGLDSVRHALEPYVRDPRVTHVVSGTKKGRGWNWTRASQGVAPYMGLLNDDDRWAPEFLERRTEFLDRHPRVGLVYSGCVVIDEAGHPLGRARLECRPWDTSAEVLLAVPLSKDLHSHSDRLDPSVRVRRRWRSVQGDASTSTQRCGCASQRYSKSAASPYGMPTIGFIPLRPRRTALLSPRSNSFFSTP